MRVISGANNVALTRFALVRAIAKETRVFDKKIP